MDRDDRRGCFGELPAGLAIVGLSVGGAVAYGIVHDQVTIRICLEYFTVFHPPVFETKDPTLLALGWGVIATWWAGVLIGVPLAVASRAGRAPKRSARDLLAPVAVLLLFMAAVATAAGVVGRILAGTGAIFVAGSMAEDIPADRHVDFLTALWVHNGSYFAGLVGGLFLAIRTWRRRGRGGSAPGDRPGPAAPVSFGQAWAALGLGSLVIMAGLMQTGMDEEFLPRFHFPLVNVACGIAAVVLGLFALRASILDRERPGSRSPLLRNAGTITALLLPAALVVQGFAEGVVGEKRFDMTWSTTAYRIGTGDRTSVRLEFADHPGWATDIESQELADHLATLRTPRVPVVIRTVRDFGILRRLKVVRVAGRGEWSYNDHAGWTGNRGWMRGLTPLREGVGPPPIR